MIAAGLNGPWVLHEATCRACADITSAFEGRALGSIFGAARVGLKMRMGSPPTNLPLLVDRIGDGEFTELDALVEDNPATVVFLEYPPPAYVDGRPYTSDVSVIGSRLVHFTGPTPDEVARGLGVKQLRVTATFHGLNFERLIAKIAYTCLVVDGLNGVEIAYVLPAILGQTDDIGRWFGCDGMAYTTDPRYLHGVSLLVVDREVISRVRLFVDALTPEYVVVVGRLMPDAVRGKFRPTAPTGEIRNVVLLEDVLANA